MAKNLPTRPDVNQRAVQMPQNVLDPLYFFFLSQLLDVVVEQRSQIETLRLAVNETRANPTTVYPSVPAF